MNQTIDENKIRQMVRRVVYRTLGIEQTPSRGSGRPVITELKIRNLAHGSEFVIPANALITPLARQVALERRITLTKESDSPSPYSEHSSPTPERERNTKTVAIGADHGGYALKESLRSYLTELGYQVKDAGTNSKESVDYPDYAYAVARMVAQGEAWRGIMIDGAGIGSCMAANKVPGIRAAMCYDLATAANSREHNDANVLTLGAGMIGPNLARQIVKLWLETSVGAERHVKRVGKIMAIERRYLKS